MASGIFTSPLRGSLNIQLINSPRFQRKIVNYSSFLLGRLHNKFRFARTKYCFFCEILFGWQEISQYVTKINFRVSLSARSRNFADTLGAVRNICRFSIAFESRRISCRRFSLSSHTLIYTQ